MTSLAMGMALYRQGRFAEAEASFRSVLAQRPGEFAALIALASVLTEQRRFAEALALAERAIQIKPTETDANAIRAGALFMLGRFNDALTAFETILSRNPADLQTRYNLGVIFTELGRLDDALAAYDLVLARERDNVAALYNRANVLAALSRHEEALVAYDGVLAKSPNDPNVLINRGNVLASLGMQVEALACFDRAIAVNPSNANAHNNRGIALKQLGRLPEALASFDHALAADPRYINARYNRGNTLLTLRDYEKARIDLESLLAIEPSHAEALNALMICCANTCDWERTSALTEAVMAAAAKGNITPFTLLNLDITPEKSLGYIRNYARCNDRVVTVASREHKRHDKIKVAYFSSDFRQHPVGTLIVRLLELHDRTKFEIIGISFGDDDNSEIRQRLIRAFDRFHDVRLQSDGDIANLIRTHDVDILVDLNGRTDHARAGVLAMRAAPIQINYLGYPGTMGADFIDYIIADRAVIPEKHQGYYTEKIIYMPDTFQANDRIPGAVEKLWARTTVVLPAHGVIFCCFNGSYKIKTAVFDSWMRILRQVDGSVLWLFADGPSTQMNLRREAMARGVAADRLVFAPRVPLPEHQARMQLADLFLDTLPFNGGATASGALWAGVPVLTRIGDTFAGRMGASLLSAIGLPELIASSAEAYEAMAVNLGSHPEKIAAIKRKLADNRLVMPLFDTERFTRHLEAAYVAIHARQLRGEPAVTFDVERLASV